MVARGNKAIISGTDDDYDWEVVQKLYGYAYQGVSSFRQALFSQSVEHQL